LKRARRFPSLVALTIRDRRFRALCAAHLAQLGGSPPRVVHARSAVAGVGGETRRLRGEIPRREQQRPQPFVADGKPLRSGSHPDRAYSGVSLLQRSRRLEARGIPPETWSHWY
jgi:hypothetical protein